MRSRFIASTAAFLVLMLWTNFLGSQTATVAITWPNGGGLGRGTIRLDLNGGDSNGGYSIARNYGEFSTAQGIAAGFGGRISLESRSPVWARGNRDGTVSMWWRGTSGLTSISACITPAGAANVCTTLPGASVVTSITGVQLSDSADPPPVISALSASHAAAGSQITIYGTNLGYDTDDTSITLNGVAMDIASVDPDSVVVLLRGTDTSGSIIAKVSGITSNAVPFTVDQAPSGPAPGTILYSYNISTPSGTSGYDAAGNITAYSDTVNKTWSIQYDNLNRLKSATQSSTDEQFYTPWGNAMQQSLCWAYDDFGNRPAQVLSNQAFTDLSSCATSSTAVTSQMRLNFDDSSNRVTTSGYVYNADGSLKTDGRNTYFYDGSGRLCAVEKNVIGAYTAYLYDADGNRVGKGNAFPSSGGDPCDFSSNQFQLTNEYFLDSTGHQLTEFDAQGNWLNTNVFSDQSLTATYNSSGLHYHVNDWLGTSRVEMNSTDTPEHKYSSTPFGDSLSSNDGSSDLFFTGKERDAESGLDYFKYRMYASFMGRWMSPDPSGLTHADLSNPQSLNLYSYVGNNPLTRTDLYGLCWKGFQWACNAAQAIDNGFHGLGFQTNASVDREQHIANQVLHHDGIQTEGLNRRQIRKAYKLDMALGSVRAEGDDGFTYVSRGRPSAAQARAIWEKATGGKVPWDGTMGRFYDMSHKTPVGDGGNPTDPENLEPMLHSDHVEMHRQNGDFARWGARGSAPRQPGEPLDTVIEPGVPVEPIIPIEPIILP